MTIESYLHAFWESWQGNENSDFRKKVNETLREMYYKLGFKKVKALETIEDLVTEGRTYTVHLVKDEFFPEGEEAILGDNGEFITLPVFKSEKTN